MQRYLGNLLGQMRLPTMTDMSYQALLFCADEKTVRVASQLLGELDFSVEACAEPFGAVKKLTSQHFDALVVDCDNEQNATLLFKTARNSELNRASLAVGLTEGQAGIAKAFRIGANLVLTKPINVEQARGTLRVARGLLRKAEAAKTAAAEHPANSAQDPSRMASTSLPDITAESSDTPEIAPLEVVSALETATASEPLITLQSVPEPLAETETKSDSPSTSLQPAVAGSAELQVEEKEPAPQLNAAEAGLLESMPNPVVARPAEIATIPAGGAAAHVVEILARTEVAAGTMASSAGAASAPALAKAKEETASPKAEPATPAPPSGPKATPRRSSSGASAIRKASIKPAAATASKSRLSWGEEGNELQAAPGSDSKKNFIIAAALVVGIAVGGYFAWPRLEPLLKNLPLVQKYILHTELQPATPVHISAVAATTAGAPASPVTNTEKPAEASAASATTPAEGVRPEASESSPPALESSENREPQPAIAKPPAANALSGSDAKTPESSATSQSVHPTPHKKAQELMVVKGGRLAQPSGASAALAPPAVGVAPDSASNAVAGIVSSASAAKPIYQPLHISQGVSQGMLVKKVAPTYPNLAQQMRVQGAVDMQATVNKDGTVSNIKVLRGDSMLVPSAVSAVRQWKYKPYLLNGQPVEIQTDITVNFTLPE